jgi:DNA-binding response OmpR family regulator
VLVYESDGRLAGLLRAAVEARGWSLHELRHLEACQNLLRRGGTGVLVLKVGPDAERELTALARLRGLYPGAKLVAVGDAEDPRLSALAWELGADYVLFPPLTRDLLPDVVAALMTAAHRSPP